MINNEPRILIVDDDLAVIDEISRCLVSLNSSIKPVIADDPQKAIALIKDSIQFDLFFIDYVFSGSVITGLDIFQEIKKPYRNNVYVGVLVTGCGTAGLFTRELASGLFSDCIEKPFAEFNNLKEKINSALLLLRRRQEQHR